MTLVSTSNNEKITFCRFVYFNLKNIKVCLETLQMWHIMKFSFLIILRLNNKAYFVFCQYYTEHPNIYEWS